MADSNVPITAGSGTNIDTYAISGGDHQQVVREARATAVTASQWAVTAEGRSLVIAADTSRVGMLIVSNATSRVYLRFGSLIPYTSDFDWFLDPGDRWEVPMWWVTLSISMKGTTAGGQILWNLATAA